MAKQVKKPIEAKKPEVNDWLDDEEPKEVEVVEPKPVEAEVTVLSLHPGDIIYSGGILGFKDKAKMPRQHAERIVAQFPKVEIL